MTISSAISFAFDAENFWPPQMRTEGRKFIEENGTEEQKKALGVLPSKEAERPRMSAPQHHNNSRMGAIR